MHQNLLHIVYDLTRAEPSAYTALKKAFQSMGETVAPTKSQRWIATDASAQDVIRVFHHVATAGCTLTVNVLDPDNLIYVGEDERVLRFLMKYGKQFPRAA